MPLILLPNAYGNAATNMAVDASLLYTLPKNIAAFRHYGWSEPAISFGYTQHYAEVCAQSDDGLILCRRITGGGMVDHRNDWTYSLTLQAALPAAQAPATELYKTIHTCIQQALAKQQVQSQLAPCPKACGQPAPAKSSTASQCFTRPEANDIIRPDGEKIAGAAMKRTREGLLIQGSVDRAALPHDFDYTAFSLSLTAQLSEALHLPIGTTEDLRTLFDGPRIQEERQRFASDKWTQKR